MVQFNEIIFEVSSKLFCKDHETSDWILAGVTCFHLTCIIYDMWTWKWKQIELQSWHQKPTFVFGFPEWECSFIFHISTEEPGQTFAGQNFKFTGQIPDAQCQFAGLPLSGTLTSSPERNLKVKHHSLGYTASTLLIICPPCLLC